jgi:hypothetical protein
MLMAIQKRIRRDEKIFLHPVRHNTFEISNRNNQVLVDSSEDYFIYFKNVTFREFGIIEGRYLGENPKALIDDRCKNVSYSVDRSKWVSENGKPFKTARMVAVNNKTGVIVVIES